MPPEVRPKKSAYLIALAFFLAGGLLLAFSIVNLVSAATPEKYCDLSASEVELPKGRLSICYEDDEIRTFTDMPVFTATFTNVETNAVYKSRRADDQWDYTVSRHSRGMEDAPGHRGTLQGRVLATVDIEQAGTYEVSFDGIFTFHSQVNGFKMLAVRKNPVLLAPAVVMLVLSSVFFLVGTLASFIRVHRKRKVALRQLYTPQPMAAPAPDYRSFVLSGVAPGGAAPAWQGPGPQPGAYPPGQPAYPYPYPSAGPAPVNPGSTGFLVWSIINTVCLFPVILPILAWVQAAKARRAPTPALLQKHRRLCLIFNLTSYGLIFAGAIFNAINTALGG